MNSLTRFGTSLSNFLDKHYKLMVFSALGLQAFFTFFIVLTSQLTWDRGFWYDISRNFPEGTPYLTTDEFVPGGNDYPVLLTYLLILLKPFAVNFEFFSIIFGLIQVLFSSLIFYFTYKLLIHFKLKKHKLIALCAAPVYLSLAMVRFDLIPTAFLVAALYCLLKKRDRVSAVLAGLGFCFKFFPAALLPAALFSKKTNFKRFLLLFSFTVFLIYLPAIILQPSTVFSSIQSVAPRAESFFGLLGLLGLGIPYYSLINLFLMIGLVLITLIKVRKPVNIAFCLIIVLLVSSTIFSPQWTVWLLPLLLLAGFSPLIILAYDWITFIEFPFVWNLANGLTGFSAELFVLSNPIVFLFVLLNFARYGFLYYFFIKSLG